MLFWAYWYYVERLFIVFDIYLPEQQHYLPYVEAHVLLCAATAGIVAIGIMTAGHEPRRAIGIVIDGCRL